MWEEKCSMALLEVVVIGCWFACLLERSLACLLYVVAVDLAAG